MASAGASPTKAFVVEFEAAGPMHVPYKNAFAGRNTGKRSPHRHKSDACWEFTVSDGPVTLRTGLPPRAEQC